MYRSLDEAKCFCCGMEGGSRLIRGRVLGLRVVQGGRHIPAQGGDDLRRRGSVLRRQHVLDRPGKSAWRRRRRSPRLVVHRSGREAPPGTARGGEGSRGSGRAAHRGGEGRGAGARRPVLLVERRWVRVELHGASLSTVDCFCKDRNASEKL